MINLVAFLGAQTESALITYESTYYLVETDLPAQRAKWIGQVMDATGKEYARRFQNFRGVVRQKPRLRVFANRERYLAALARACGEPNVHARGIFCRLDGIVYTHEGHGLERILKHECFHQYSSLVIGGRLPTWTDEGLAEYFQEGVFDEQDGRLKLGAVPKWRLNVLRQARTKNLLLPVEQLMHLSQREWNDNMRRDQGAVQYCQAWLLCHLLVYGDRGNYQSLFEKYLRHLDQGLDPDTAFKRVFGADLKPLERKLDDYLRELKPRKPTK